MLTEARNGKELSEVVFINQINSPPLPWAKDPSKRRLRVIPNGYSRVLPQSPPPPPQRNPGPHPLP